jgi:hypothetical protein
MGNVYLALGCLSKLYESWVGWMDGILFGVGVGDLYGFLYVYCEHVYPMHHVFSVGGAVVKDIRFMTWLLYSSLCLRMCSQCDVYLVAGVHKVCHVAAGHWRCLDAFGLLATRSAGSRQ